MKRLLFLIILFVSANTCRDNPQTETSNPSLKEAFHDSFMMGAALNRDQISGQDSAGIEIVEHHFNTITPENILKWENVHPQPEEYDFDVVDQFVQFGEENDMFIVGHTLIWHNQTPEWVFEDEEGNQLDREVLLERMRVHIHTIVGRYKGQINGWDVVNEALDEDGSLRQTPWLEIIGEDYISKAFEFAREADPDAELYYNDYSLENPPKREGAIRLVQNLQENGAPITGIGTQGHFNLNQPTLQQIEETITSFADLDVDVMVTELDIDVLPSAYGTSADISMNSELQDSLNPYINGLPDSVQYTLTQRYKEIFQIFYRYRDDITRVTFWGVSDGDSWKNNWPVRGRTNYPLLFDREHQPKPAFYEVIEIPN